jgi:hypothetical protein
MSVKSVLCGFLSNNQGNQILKWSSQNPKLRVLPVLPEEKAKGPSLSPEPRLGLGQVS